MSSRSLEAHLKDIVTAVEWIELFTTGLSFEV